MPPASSQYKSRSAKRRPLHLRVLDLSRVLAGPWASQVLADLGAEVIKVERPGEGDDTRDWGPPFAKDRPAPRRASRGLLPRRNRGKKSITLDLARPEGQAIVRRLAERADVLIENYKVGALARYGLDYDDLARLNPRLVYCSITGFGQTGPYRGPARLRLPDPGDGRADERHRRADDGPAAGR